MELSKEILAPYAKNHKILDETYALHVYFMEAKAQPSYIIGVEKAREQALRLATGLQGTVEFSGKETEMTVPSPHVPEGIPITVYKPDACADNPTILVFFHGGGLITGSRSSISTTLKIIAMESGAICVNVEYRLLPNTESPCAPFEDGITATQWVMGNKMAVGGTESTKVGVGGESSGGHVTACVTNAVMGLAFQILVYPVVDTSLSQDSFTEFETMPFLGKRSMRFFFENSMDHIPNHVNDPRYNPMARTNTASSPPALIILAELDILVGCGLDYAEKLRTAGVPVQCEVIEGTVHAVFTSRTVTKTATAQLYDQVVKFIKQF